MAYSLYEDTQPNSSVQYYPEEYDSSSYYHKISEVKGNYPSIPSTKKTKKPVPSINYVNERKCPIYVHQYNKAQNASTYNNYSSKTPKKPPPEKNLPKLKKVPGFPTTKSVLDQLEETYWATWKPNNKETANTKNKLPDKRISKIEAYGDVPDSITNYFNSLEYETSTALEESDYDRYDTVIDIEEICERRNDLSRARNMQTQEIQTDNIPAVLSQVEEKDEDDESVKVSEAGEPSLKPECKESPEEKSSDDTVQETTQEDESKFLKHTDSFIINKKKQGEVKEHFKQPKCIRLYKKPGISSTSFIRGGTYPLKSCMKRETVPKGNFRLGAPGSPLFISTSSFHKKSKK